jgi:hypothetical protein
MKSSWSFNTAFSGDTQAPNETYIQLSHGNMMHTEWCFWIPEILQNFTELLLIFFRAPTFFQWFSFDHLPFFNDFLSITYLFSMISFDHLPFFNDFLSITYLFSMILFRVPHRYVSMYVLLIYMGGPSIHTDVFVNTVFSHNLPNSYWFYFDHLTVFFYLWFIRPKNSN